jgi:hypothetical protein
MPYMMRPWIRKTCQTEAHDMVVIACPDGDHRHIACRIKCQTKVLAKADDIASFPPFVANKRDPLSRFSDAAFHRSCLERGGLTKRTDPNQPVRSVPPQSRQAVERSRAQLR